MLRLQVSLEPRLSRKFAVLALRLLAAFVGALEWPDFSVHFVHVSVEIAPFAKRVTALFGLSADVRTVVDPGDMAAVPVCVSIAVSKAQNGRTYFRRYCLSNRLKH